MTVGAPAPLHSRWIFLPPTSTPPLKSPVAADWATAATLPKMDRPMASGTRSALGTDQARGIPEASRRRHDFGDHPAALPKTPDTLETLSLEHCYCPVVQEGRLDRPAFYVFGIAFHRTSANAGDFPQRSRESSGRDATTAA